MSVIWKSRFSINKLQCCSFDTCCPWEKREALPRKRLLIEPINQSDMFPY